MEHEATALRAEVDAKSVELAEMQRRHAQSQAEVADLKAELDNNAGGCIKRSAPSAALCVHNAVHSFAPPPINSCIPGALSRNHYQERGG